MGVHAGSLSDMPSSEKRLPWNSDFRIGFSLLLLPSSLDRSPGLHDRVISERASTPATGTGAVLELLLPPCCSLAKPTSIV